MSFFKKLFGIQSPKERDSPPSQAEWNQLEEYGKKLLEEELKKDEPSIAETPPETIKDKKNVFKKPSRKKPSRKNVFKNPSKYSDSAVKTIESFHRYIERSSARAVLNILSKDEIDVMYKDWASESSRSFNDFIWSLFNLAITKNKVKEFEFNPYGISEDSLEQFYYRASMLYFSMAIFRWKESDNPKAANQFVKLFHKHQIKSFIAHENSEIIKSRLKYQAALIPSPFCEYARGLDMYYDLDDVLDKCDVVSSKCNATHNRPCQCSFSMVVKRDADGRIVRRNG